LFQSSNLEPIEELALIEPLRATEKAKEAEIFTCKLCNGKYTDETAVSGSKKNYGFCSKTCRDANRKAPPSKCEHGRDKSQCTDCGTGHCEHERRKSQCTDCGTGTCEHGRRKSQCKDCGTGHCEHGRRKCDCRDCSAGQRQHGRLEEIGGIKPLAFGQCWGGHGARPRSAPC
jgi:hypothetical protein